MQKLVFTSNDAPTIGVELELALVDAENLALRSCVNQMLEQLPDDASAQFKPELMQACIEINSGVCNTVDEARLDLLGKLQLVEQAADRIHARLWWGATHPFSSWLNQEITQDDRYLNLCESLQEMARRLITCGLHVHVGVDSGDKAVMICDRILQHLPTLLALSCTSPFWEARDTGLHSHRSKIMEGLPTAGLPPLMRNWSEYVWLVNHMVETGFINTIREIWWDVRPHHNFGTVEVRVCDMPGSLEDVLAITALVQSLVKALSDDIDQGAYQHDCHPMLVSQNKWRACRYGNQALLVDSYTFKTRSVSQIVEWMIEKLSPTAEELGCLEYLLDCRRLAGDTSWPNRQRAILAETGRPQEIVRRMTAASRTSAVKPD